MRSTWSWIRDRRAFCAAVAVCLLGLLMVASHEVVTAVTLRSAAAVPAAPVLALPPLAPPTSPVRHVRALPHSVPTDVDIPKIRAHSTLVPLGLNPDGTVQVPPVENPMQAGWYSYGPSPGEVGPAVLLGHVDGYHNPGIFYRLRDLVPGDEILVHRQDGTTPRFRVRRIEFAPKDHFPTEAVYGNTDHAELRLITCGGSFDRQAHSYRDNLIVYADLE